MEMEKMTTIPQPKGVPVELIQRIQSLLPLKEAACTCILSKSWLHAWSTIPTLKFFHPDHPRNKTYQKLIDRTLQRYHRDNIPIESFHLQLSIIRDNREELPSLAKRWIQQVVSKTCLKELSLNMKILVDDSLTLPNELFSSQNLNTINVTKAHNFQNYQLRICTNPVINCVSLRVLELHDVIITEDVLHNLLSSCSLLERIKLLRCEGFKNVKVKNLLRLHELDISTNKDYDINILEINNVPSLRTFCYISLSGRWEPLPFQMDSLESVTQLHIRGVMINKQFFNIVESKFPLLKSLTLGFRNWEFKNMVITSVSLRCLTLKVLATKSSSGHGPVNIQVNAPRLISFMYDGILIPDLTFPTIAPEQIKLTLNLMEPMDRSYFLKMRKALNLSSKFGINIINDDNYKLVPSDIDVNDLRRRVSVSVTDVQLSLVTYDDSWKHSRFFDAFFSICRPSYIKCEKLAIRKMMKGKMNDLKDVKVKNPYNGKWKALTSSWERVLKTLTGGYHFECKLNWFPR